MIYKIQEGNFVIYTSLEGYNYINDILTQEFQQSSYMRIISSINWRENKKYFKNE